MECGTEILKMNFILPHSFELDLRRECHYLVHRSFSFRVIQIRRSVQKLSSLESPSADLFELPGGWVYRQVVVISQCWRSRTARICCVFIRGKHPVCGEPLFCLSANPDSLSKLCGFHIDHRSRSFLLQASGISSLLSFCCTSLVSGFIIHIPDWFVYSQSAQG